MKVLHTRAIPNHGDQVGWLLLATLAAAGCGLAVSTQSLAIAAVIPAVALGVAVMPLISAGVFVGLALVLAANAIPGLDLTRVSVGEVNGTDLAFLALLGFAVVRRFSAPAVTKPHPLSRILGVWSILFLIVWVLAFARALDAGTDYVHALSVGRDFLYFGLTLPFARFLITNDDELRDCCIVAGAVSVLFAAAYIAASLGLAPPSLANAMLTQSQGAITRIYDSGSYLFVLVFSVSLAYGLLHRGPRARIAALVAAVTITALVLSLTRAVYIGLVLALIISLGLWAIGQGSAHGLLRRRLVAMTIATAICGMALLVAVPSVVTSGPLQSVITRASSSTSEFSSSDIATSDLAYRANVDSLMEKTLGAQWPLGLGFLSPHTNYFADLPRGEIRDSDVGVFNSIMTMGVIGTVLLYFVPISLLCVLALRAPRRAQRDSFLWMGGMIWLLIVLITSYTLVTLASVSGLATTAVGIGVLLSRLDMASRQRLSR